MYIGVVTKIIREQDPASVLFFVLGLIPLVSFACVGGPCRTGLEVDGARGDRITR